MTVSTVVTAIWSQQNSIFHSGFKILLIVKKLKMDATTSGFCHGSDLSQTIECKTVEYKTIS